VAADPNGVSDPVDAAADPALRGPGPGAPRGGRGPGRATRSRAPWVGPRPPRRTRGAPPRRGAVTPRRRRRATALLIVTVCLLVTAALLLLAPATAPRPAHSVPLSAALAAVTSGRAAAVTLNDASATMTITPTGGGEVVTATFPYAATDRLTTQLLAARVPLSVIHPAARTSPWSSLGTLLPLLLGAALIVWLLRMSGTLPGRGSKAPSALGAIPSTRFADVAGADEAVAEMAELVDYLRHPERYLAAGATAPKGALLVGPPGTGKTLLARAVAGEAGVPFYALAGSDFVDTYVGVGAKRVRQLFAKARGAGQAIVFVDEIDAVGRSRGGVGTGGDSERDNTLISLLNEMDGFTGSGVIVLAATNRPDVLDPALTRPGRLDRQVQVPHPDRRGRAQVLAVHVAGRPVHADVHLDELARRTAGFSGADLARLVNEACLEAVRTRRADADAACFERALATVAVGRARTSALVSEHDRRITAWHEAGHTLAALLLPDADDPVSVSIVPRGEAGGVTWMAGSDDAFVTRRRAHARLAVALAGRAGEEVLLDGDFTQGAHGDLASATTLAMAMVTQYGMSRLGYAYRADMVGSGGPLLADVSAVVEEILTDAHATAAALLARHPDELAALAAALLDRETLTRTEVRAVVLAAGARRAPAPSPAAAH